VAKRYGIDISLHRARQVTTSGQRSIVSGPDSSTCGCSVRATGRWSSGCYRRPAPDRANSTSRLNSMRDLPLLRNAMVSAFEAIRVADLGQSWSD
jgi:hypothetical protein